VYLGFQYPDQKIESFPQHPARVRNSKFAEGRFSNSDQSDGTNNKGYSRQ